MKTIFATITPSQSRKWSADQVGRNTADKTKDAEQGNPHFTRMMQRLPYSMYVTFSPEQLAALAWASKPDKAQHLIEYKKSFAWWRKRYYVVIYFGREKRNLARLAAENQLNLRRLQMEYWAINLLSMTGLAMLVLTLIFALILLCNLDFYETQSNLRGSIFPAIEY